MCFHPDHWTWWVVRPSNLVDILPWQKWRKPFKSFLFVLQPGHVPNNSWKNRPICASGRLPYHFGTTVFWGASLSCRKWIFYASKVWLCEFIPRKFWNCYLPLKKGKDRWASSKSIIFSNGVTVCWFFGGVTWQLDETKYKENATLQHVLEDLVSQVPIKPGRKKKTEVKLKSWIWN